MSVIVACINQKGGCGKSTFAVHLAYWLTVKKKKRVLVVDADAQRSSSLWLKDMEPVIPCEVIQSPDDLLERLPILAQEWDYLIADGPAGIAEPTRAILFRADLAIVPVQPTGVDLRSASDAVRLIKQAQSVRNGPPAAALFLSRAVKGTKLKDEAIEVLHQIQAVKLLNTAIHQRQAVADTSGQSATVWDLPGKPAAECAREFERLFKEIVRMV